MDDVKEASAGGVAENVDAAIDMVEEHVDAQGAELGEVDEQGVYYLEDREKGPLAQQHLNSGKGVSEERDGMAICAGAEDDDVKGQGNELPARNAQELNFGFRERECQKRLWA